MDPGDNSPVAPDSAPPLNRLLTLDAVRKTVSSHAPDKTPEMGRPSGVLIPLFVRDGRLYVLLTKRHADLSSHAGQISFPGGKRDPEDIDLRATALREAQEEIGLDPSAVEIVGELDDCPTFVTNYVITPVVGIIPDRYPFVPSAREIETLIEAPLDEFLVPGALRTEDKVRNGETYQMLFYSVGGHVVWGATARILTQLLSLLGAPLELS